MNALSLLISRKNQARDIRAQGTGSHVPPLCVAVVTITPPPGGGKPWDVQRVRDGAGTQGASWVWWKPSELGASSAIYYL